MRSDWEYPFSAAGMNVTFMLVDVFGLRSAAAGRDGAPGTRKHNKATLRALLEIESESDDILVAFNEVYCVAFEMLDAQWLEQKASYLQFNGAPPRRGAPRACLRTEAWRPSARARAAPVGGRRPPDLPDVGGRGPSLPAPADVLKATREKLERALSDQRVKCVSDLRRITGCIY